MPLFDHGHRIGGVKDGTSRSDEVNAMTVRPLNCYSCSHGPAGSHGCNTSAGLDRRRRFFVSAVMMVVVGSIVAPATAADGARLPRVRSDIPSTAAAIREATERSAIFRRLTETLDGTDGLVYVERGQCGHGVQACLALSVKVAGPHRVLRILVCPRKTKCELVASIGHELQHAVEVLSDPAITTNPAIFFFFHRRGSFEEGRFQTSAAIQAGLDVKADMQRQGGCRHLMRPAAG